MVYYRVLYPDWLIKPEPAVAEFQENTKYKNISHGSAGRLVFETLSEVGLVPEVIITA
jgi:hypothetical protein